MPTVLVEPQLRVRGLQVSGEGVRLLLVLALQEAGLRQDRVETL